MCNFVVLLVSHLSRGMLCFDLFEKAESCAVVATFVWRYPKKMANKLQKIGLTVTLSSEGRIYTWNYWVSIKLL